MQRLERTRPSGGTGGPSNSSRDGEGATVVTEIYDCSLVPVVERQQMDNGRMWIGSMTATLGHLEQLCAAGLA